MNFTKTYPHVYMLHDDMTNLNEPKASFAVHQENK